MKRIVVLIIVVSLTGCTTLRPLAGAPVELRDAIASGQAVGAGDHVRVTTVDGKNHDLVLVKVADGQLVGARESIAIDDVVALKKRQPSFGKTFALAVVVGAVAILGGMFLAWQHGGGVTLTGLMGG